jgi:hypothetical protein
MDFSIEPHSKCVFIICAICVVCADVVWGRILLLFLWRPRGVFAICTGTTLGSL